MEDFNVESGHQCPACSYVLCEEGSEIFGNLSELEQSISLETKMSLVYIAGYVTRKDKELCENELLAQTNLYYEKSGHFTVSLDRGGLNVPSDCACQWTSFCFIMFNTVKDKVCRRSLCNIIVSSGVLFIQHGKTPLYDFGSRERHECYAITSLV